MLEALAITFLSICGLGLLAALNYDRIRKRRAILSWFTVNQDTRITDDAVA